MAHVTADRVRDTSTTTGTGAFAVSGTAPTGYRTFSAVLATNDTCWYAIQHQTAAEWEVGLGTYSSANTITRTTVLASSNAGSPVSFSAGTKDIFITLAAGKTVQQDNSGAVGIDANSSSAALRITQTGAGNALLVEDSTNPDATPFVVNASGNVVVGNTTAVGSEKLQVIGTSYGTSSTSFLRYSADTDGSYLAYYKSRSATIGSNTVVNSGDNLGHIVFSGDDGAAFINAARITAAVDGTPGTNDMPGRLVFSTTADGASSPTERMRIDNAGQVGIGAVPSATTLRLGKAVTGATTSNVIRSDGVIQSDVTTEYRGFLSFPTTQATSFTLTTLSHYATVQGTFGSGSFVTNQYGVNVASSLIGAANNYGFYGNIGAGVSRNITTVERTSNVVTITTSVTHGYSAGQSVTVAAVTNTSLNGTFTIASVPTTTTFTYAQTAADLASTADTGTTVVVGRYNFYANGTAPNFFNGVTNFGASLPNGVQVPNSTGNLVTPIVQLNATNSIGVYSAVNWGTSATGHPAAISFAKSKSGVAGTQTAVASGDVIASLLFLGSDGTSFVRAGEITSEVDGTPGTNDMPGRIVFKTTLDGASTPTEQMRISNNGSIGIGTTATAGYKINIGGSATGATSYEGVANGQTIQSDVTSLYRGFLSVPGTQAAAFTLADLRHFAAQQNVFGAGSSVTNQYGVFISSSLTGATNNYGVYSAIASGTGRYNFYAVGTADNYFAGNVGIGITSPGNKLDVQANTSSQIRVGWVAGTATAYYDFGRDASDGLFGFNGAQTTFVGYKWATNGTERMRIDSSGNVGIGTSTFGTSAAKVLALGNATAPTTGPADTIQIYSTDLSAGNTMLSLYTEGTVVNANTTAATTHRIAIRVNGTVYYLLANTAA